MQWNKPVDEEIKRFGRTYIYDSAGNLIFKSDIIDNDGMLSKVQIYVLIVLLTLTLIFCVWYMTKLGW